VLVKQLQLADCTSIVASNGLGALQVISTSTFSASAGANAVVFDVCLMDIEMPVMDGITACHRIREMEKSGELSRRVPLIAITANAREEQVNRILGEGFDEVLTKPFRVPTLLKMIEGLIMKNQLQ
jgi:CheY-like chemotaxis protein